MDIKDLRNKNGLIDLFCTLAEIPSPSLGEDCVATEILTTLMSCGAEVKKDDYANVIARIPATDKNRKPLLFSAHMDVVGDDSPVKIRLSDDGYIETDKKRTLGADDKAGIAVAIDVARKILKDKNLKHGGLELVFTRDEESGMSGIKHVNMSELESEYALVLDSDSFGEVMISGAGYTKVTIEAESLKGGHSGNDIADTTRVNAAKLIADVVAEVPQGVYKQDSEGVITSINLGVIIGGGLDFPLQKMTKSDLKNDEHFDYLVKNAVTNVINKRGAAIYSLRSSDSAAERKLLGEIQDIVDKYNDIYKGDATVRLIVEEHLKKFEKNEDTTISDVAKLVGQDKNYDIRVASFHAGAETHIYAGAKNKYGKTFKPYLLGVATIKNMHSQDERMDYSSLIRGADFLYHLFLKFNMQQV